MMTINNYAVIFCLGEDVNKYDIFCIQWYLGTEIKNISEIRTKSWGMNLKIVTNLFQRSWIIIRDVIVDKTKNCTRYYGLLERLCWILYIKYCVLWQRSWRIITDTLTGDCIQCIFIQFMTYCIIIEIMSDYHRFFIRLWEGSWHVITNFTTDCEI